MARGIVKGGKNDLNDLLTAAGKNFSGVPKASKVATTGLYKKAEFLGKGWVTGLFDTYAGANANSMHIVIDGVQVAGFKTEGIPFIYRFEQSAAIYSDDTVAMAITVGDDFLAGEKKIVGVTGGSQAVSLRHSVTGSGLIYGLLGAEDYVKLIIDGVQLLPEGTSVSTSQKIGCAPMILRFNKGFEYYTSSSTSPSILYTLDK